MPRRNILILRHSVDDLPTTSCSAATPNRRHEKRFRIGNLIRIATLMLSVIDHSDQPSFAAKVNQDGGIRTEPSKVPLRIICIASFIDLHYCALSQFGHWGARLQFRQTADTIPADRRYNSGRPPSIGSASFKSIVPLAPQETSGCLLNESTSLPWGVFYVIPSPFGYLIVWLDCD